MKDQTMKEMPMKEIEIFLDGHDSSIFRMDRCVYMKNIHLVFCQMVSYNYFPVNWNFQFNPYCQQIIGEFPGHNLCRISRTILLENSFKGSSDQSQFILKINIVKSRIRHTTTLKLNDGFLDRFQID